MELIKKILYKISKDDLGFFAGAFSYFMFFSTAALTLFLFLLFGEQVSFSVLKYLSPDYEATAKACHYFPDHKCKMVMVSAYSTGLGQHQCFRFAGTCCHGHC